MHTYFFSHKNQDKDLRDDSVGQSWTIWVWSLGPTWWEERRLRSVVIWTHTISKCNLKKLKSRQVSDGPQTIFQLKRKQLLCNSILPRKRHQSSALWAGSSQALCYHPSSGPLPPPQCHTNPLLSSWVSSSRQLKHLPNRSQWGFSITSVRKKKKPKKKKWFLMLHYALCGRSTSHILCFLLFRLKMVTATQRSSVRNRSLMALLVLRIR